jgi:hypothetical protein
MADIDKLNIDSIIQRLLEGEGGGGGGPSGDPRGSREGAESRLGCGAPGLSPEGTRRAAAGRPAAGSRTRRHPPPLGLRSFIAVGSILSAGGGI